MVYKIAIALIALVSMSGLVHADGVRHFSGVDPASSWYGKDALADSWLDVDGIAQPQQIQIPNTTGWNDVSPNIIADKFRWRQISESVGAGVFHYKVYNPVNRDPHAAPIVVFLIHGTNARAHSPEYMDENEENRMNLLPKTKKFAEQAAYYQNTSVHMLTFGWTGAEEDSARRSAGQVLADLINTYFSNFRVVTIAHSHGGNVVNHASHSLFNSIALAVHIGAPIIQEGHDFKECRPMNIDLLLNFYSTGDIIQLGGGCNAHRSIGIIAKKAASYVGDKFSAFGRGFKGLFGGNKVTLPLEQEMQDLAAGAHPGDYTWGIVHMFDPQRKISMTDDEMQQAHVKRIVNIRTQLNGCDPDHSILKQGVLSELWNVRARVVQRYIANDDLDLNIDLEKNTAEDKRLILAIRNLPTTDMLHKQESAQQEVPYSNEQKKKFSDLYRRDIFSKGNIFSRIYTQLYNMPCKAGKKLFATGR